MVTYLHSAYIGHVLKGHLAELRRFTLADHLKNHGANKSVRSGNTSRCRESDILGAKIWLDYEVTTESAARQEFSLYILDFLIPAGTGDGWISLKDRLR
ncbi:MAG: hypothetical protein ACKVS9_14950 [Phycisphaerae bacterium]